MELLYNRLGHTSKGGMERLGHDETVRGLKDGIKVDLGICRGCKTGKSSKKSHPKKDPIYRGTEPSELVHTNIAGPFKPKAIEAGD